MTYLPRAPCFFRPFWQKQGTAVAGTWVWSADALETNFASVTNEAAGIYTNSSAAVSDEYKWSNIFLTKGTYKITIIYKANSNSGVAQVLFGTTSLTTLDMSAAAIAANQLWEITFTLTADTTADMRFKVSAGSGGNSIDFSRFQIEKTG